MTAPDAAAATYSRGYVAQQREHYGLPKTYAGIPVTSHAIMWMDHFFAPMGLPMYPCDEYDGTYTLRTASTLPLGDGTKVRVPSVCVTFNRRGYWIGSRISYGRRITAATNRNASEIRMEISRYDLRLSVDKIIQFRERAIDADLYVPAADPNFRYEDCPSWFGYFSRPDTPTPNWIASATEQFAAAKQAREEAAFAAQQEQWDAAAREMAIEALIAAHEDEFTSLVARSHAFIRLT